MKKYITGISYLLGALLLWIGPKTIFQVCEATEKKMKCYWTTRAEAGIGILLAAAGILIIFTASEQVRIGIHRMVVAISVVGLLIPAWLIGGCQNQMMPCRKVTFPAFYLIHGVLLIISLIASFTKENKYRTE